MSDTATPEKPEEKPRKKKRRVVLKLFMTLVVLVALALCLLPYGIQWGALRWLAQNGLEEARIANVDLNLFTGALVIEGLDGGGVQRLRAGRAEIAWRTGPLFSKKLYITAVGLYDAAVDIDIGADGSVRAGGLTLPAAAGAPAPESESAWEMGLDAVVVKNVSVNGKEPRIALAAEVAHFRTGAISTWEPERDTALALDMTLNGAPLKVDGTVRVLSPDRRVALSASIQDFDLAALAEVAAPQGVENLKGRLSAKQRISGAILISEWSASLDCEGTAGLTGASILRDGNAVSGDRFDWNGRLSVEGNLRQPKMTLAGTAALAQLKAASADYALDLASASAELDVALSMPAATQLDTKWKVDAKGAALAASGSGLPEIPIAGSPITPEEGRASAFGFNSEGSISLNRAGAMQGTLTTRIEAEGPALLAVGVGEPVLQAETFQSVLSDAVLGGKIDAPTYGGRIEVETVGGRAAHEALGYAAGAGELAAAMTLKLTQAGEGFRVEALTVRGKALAVDDLGRGASLARIAGVDFDGYSGTGTDLLLGNLQVEGAEFIDRASYGAAVSGPEGTQLLQFSSLALRELRVNALKPSVGEVVLRDLAAWVQIDDTGKPEALAWLPGGTTPEDAEPAAEAVEIAEPVEVAELEADTPAAGLPPLRIDRILIEGDNRIALRDGSVNPAVRMNLRPFSLRLGAVDTTLLDGLTPVAFDGKLGDYSELMVEGELSLLAPRPSGTLIAQAKGVDLHEITAYAERFTGYRLNRGTLDSKLNLNIERGVIDANSEILIAKLELQRLKADELDPFEEQIGMPVNAAVSLLRDREDNIKLAIPVTGDLSDPQIDVSDAVGQAVMRGTARAVKTGVMAYFAPVGVAVIVGKAAKRAGELRFNPVAFPAGEAMLDEEDTAYLDTLAQLLRDRPGVSLTLCGVATHEDLAFFMEAMRAEAEAEAAAAAVLPQEAHTAEGAPETEEAVALREIPTPVVQKNTLLELALARAAAVKAYLVGTAEIDAARLFSCAPSYEQASEEAPRVAVRL